MTRLVAWLTVLLVGSTALAMLLLGLAFVPTTAWETFVPLATVLGIVGVVVSGLAVEVIGERSLRPLRRLARSIEDDELGEPSLRELVRGAPPEVAPLLYGLHLTHTRLRRSLRQIEQDRADVATIFEHMTDSVLVLDGREHIILSNPAAARMLRASEPVGRTLAEVCRDADLVQLARAASAGTSKLKVLEVVVEQGDRRWIRAVASPLPAGRRLLVLQDVSDSRRAEAARRDFVANVSHELRTPVAALKALVETLEQGAMEDPVEGPGFLHRMHVEVDGLAQLVTELLDLARAEAGRLDLDLAPCRTDELVRDAVERILPTARQLGIDVDVEVKAPEDDLWVYADARRVGQVLSNLLANAVKFTPSGGRIEAGARRRGERVEVWVSDTGVGIERQHLGRVFERFYKTDPARAAGSGTGLGLAIAKHLVLAHGGDIRAASAGAGRGATFWVSLPAVPDGTTMDGPR